MKRGTIFGFPMQTLMPVGALPVSYFAETIGIDMALLGCAVGLGAVTFALMILVTVLRTIDDTHKAPLLAARP